jgi:hypothetical protein
MMRVEIRRSRRRDKKWDAVLMREGRSRTVPFGARGYDDFTLTGDREQRERYLARHRAREDWSDPTTPGFWAARLLWNKPTLRASVADVNRRFRNLRVTVA